jgi:hypothetical protein
MTMQDVVYVGVNMHFPHFTTNNACVTKHHCRVVYSPLSSSPRVKSLPRVWPFGLRFFMGFLSPSRKMPDSASNLAMIISASFPVPYYLMILSFDAIYIYLLLTAIGLMPGGSEYKQTYIHK